jgi:hypothetical protein
VAGVDAVTDRRRQRIARVEAKRPPQHEPTVIVTRSPVPAHVLDELAEEISALLDRVRREGGG